VDEVIGRGRSRHGGIMPGSGIRIQIPPPSLAEARQVLAAVPNVTSVTPAGENDGWLRVEFANSSDGDAAENPYLNNRILEALIRAEIPILDFETERSRLQDVFLHLTKEAVA
jgi:ABC-2 type transport system ATP-binding protein